jgi:mannose-6-phosphate isomerase-like protein (cupin superfamily)
MPEEIKKVDKVWGSEEWIANTDKYCGKILNLNKGYRCSLHYHKNKDETFYILDGEVLIELGDERKMLKKGDSIRVLPGVKHRFTGLKKSKIIEFSTHHEETDSYRDTQSEKVNLKEIGADK